MKTNFYKLTTIILLLLLIGFIYAFLIRGSVVSNIKDTRVTISITEKNHDFVMLEMRDFLKNIQKISEGIAANNKDVIVEAATKSGEDVANHIPKGLIATLPIGFKKMGFQVHDQFDEIATIAKEKFDTQEIHVKMNQLMTNCVTCHNTYKFSLKK